MRRRPHPNGDSPLVPDLGRRIWLLVLVNCLANAGSGLTLPYLIVYLHNARGIPLGRAGLLLALIGAAGIAATPVAGALADRIGARRTFFIGELIFMAGALAFIPASDFVAALGPSLAFGFAGGLTWSGLYVMLGEGAPSARRNEAFGVSNALATVGIGLGALVAGFVVDVHAPHSFVALFGGDAASNLFFAAVLLLMRDPAPEAVVAVPPPADSATALRGYRQVLRDKVLLAVFAVNTLVVTVATSQMSSGFPAWVTGPAHSTPRVVGAAFAANTLTLLATQLFVLRLIRRRRRTSAAAGGALVFALAWLLVLGGGHASGGTVTAVVLVAALAALAIGESLVAPTLPALVNDLAPSALRGRYNALFTLSWQIGPVIGPALAGFMLGRSLGDELLLLLAGACVAAALAANRLKRLVPRRVDVPSDARAPKLGPADPGQGETVGDNGPMRAPDGQIKQAARSWDLEYEGGRYRDESPLPFVADIVAAARAHDLLGADGIYIGCGNGRNYLPLVAAGLDLIGVDISKSALAQLAARAPEQRDRLVHGDLTALPAGAAYPVVIGVQVFQHGSRAEAHEHIAAAQTRLLPGGLFCSRVNAVGTDIEYAHDLVERASDGGLTVRYRAGPKKGLEIHFFTAAELAALFAGYEPVLVPRLVRTWRKPRRRGQWSQWEAIWRKRS